MYHDIGDDNEGAITNVDLFGKEMKYLHDNNFHVITISDLSYDENNDYLYVKDVALEPELPSENVTAPIVKPTENVTANVTVPVEVPAINATANVTAPVEVPAINATANVLLQLKCSNNALPMLLLQLKCQNNVLPCYCSILKCQLLCQCYCSS